MGNQTHQSPRDHGSCPDASRERDRFSYRSAIQLQFVEKPPIEPAKVLNLMRRKKNYGFAGQDRLRNELKLPDVRARVTAIREVFGELG